MAGSRGAIVFENKNALPRTFLASSYITRSTDQDSIDTLYSKDFDLRETLVLETDPEVKPQLGDGRVTITKYTPNEVVIRATSLVPKLLFLSDVYDTGWKATVDGKGARIYRADYDFRAVAVPAGEHTIRFVYWPRSFVYGLWISAIAIGLLVVLMFRLKKL